MAGRIRLLVLVLLLPAVLAACTVREQREPVVGEHDQLRALDEIVRTLQGNYSNHLQWRNEGGDDDGPYSLSIRLEPVPGAQTVAFLLEQTSARGEARRFALEFAPTPVAGRFAGMFSPLDRTPERFPYCEMQFVLVSAGFSGETDPQQCGFEDRGQHVGLLKEIAFDGHQIVIAEQLQRAGAPVHEPQVLRFFRERRFQGWAGIRDGDQWRLSSELLLHSEGDASEPRDANGQSLGIRIQLARLLWREDQPPILRLSIHDSASGRLLGYAWADPDATQLGINLPDVQAGLTALPE